MNLLAMLSLSVGMSMDAFAAATAKGATDGFTRFIRALKDGLTFGIIEAIAMVIGYSLGVVVDGWVAQIDHWLAFGLLSLLGGRFIYDAITKSADGIKIHSGEGVGDGAKSSPLMLILTAIATSIDSVVVGVSLGMIGVNIALMAVLIGMATTVMATIGLYLGRRLNARFGRMAMGLGGVVLIGIGAWILITHLVG